MLVAIDAEGQMYTYRVTFPHPDSAGGQQLNYAVSLLEYCLVSGYDALDVFLLLKQHQVESLVDRLTENFTRQPAYVQQYFYVQFYAMKTNLYRLLAGGSQRAQDLTSFQMLHSILIGFKCLLRPAELSRNDKGPAENLASKAFRMVSKFIVVYGLCEYLGSIDVCVCVCFCIHSGAIRNGFD